jgi:hypothetical protein
MNVFVAKQKNVTHELSLIVIDGYIAMTGKISTRGIRRIFRFAGKCTGNVSPPFRQRPDRQRTAILLLLVSNPTRRHRHLRTVLPVLIQTETSRNGAAGHREILFYR